MSKDVNSQPELLFLQFKPHGKEDFTSFSNKLPNTSNPSKKPWKPPIKTISDPMTTELLGTAKENMGNSQCPDNVNLINDCKQTETKDTTGDPCNDTAVLSISNTHKQQVFESTSVKSGTQNEKCSSDSAQKHSFTVDMNDCEGNKIHGNKDELVKESGRNSILITEKERNMQDVDSQHTIQLTDIQDSKTYNGENLETGGTRLSNSNLRDENILANNLEDSTILKCTPLLHGNNEVINAKHEKICSTDVELECASNSVASDDELTQTNPWILEKSNLYKSVSLLSNNSISDEDSTSPNPWLSGKSILEKSLNINNYNSSHENFAGFSSNISNEQKLNKNIENDKFKEVERQVKEKSYDICHFKEFGCNSKIELAQDSPKPQNIEESNMDKFSNYNSNYLPSHQITGKEITKTNVGFEKVTTNIMCEEQNEYSEFRKQACEEGLVESPKLGKTNSFQEQTDSVMKKCNNLSNFNKENSNEVDFHGKVLSQTNAVYEPFEEESQFPKLDVTNTAGTCSNYFQNNLSQNKDLAHPEKKQIEPDSSKNFDFTNILSYNNHCKDKENLLQADNVSSEIKQSNSLIFSKIQTNPLYYTKPMRNETAHIYNRYSNNTNLSLSESILKKDENMNDGNYSQKSREEMASLQNACLRSDENRQTTENQQKETIETKTNGNSSTNNNQFESTVQLNPDKENLRNFQNGNNVLEDEYSCLMISNSQLLEIEQKYYEAPESVESEFLECKTQTSTTRYCETATVGTQTDCKENQPPVATAEHDVPHPFHSSQAQWTTKMLETKRKLRETIQEVNRLK